MKSERIINGNRAMTLHIVSTVLAVAAAAAASDQCNTWTDVGGGVNGFVYDMKVVDGDLIVCGQFTDASGTPASRVARWDGEQWHALGNGVSATANALAVYDGDLIVGGRFSVAGNTPVNNIARWDGEQWHALGIGVDGPINPRVLALHVHEGDLYAAGLFTQLASGEPVNGIARWDGTQWHPVGDGLSDNAESNPVTAITTYEGQLIAAGNFTGVDGDAPLLKIAYWHEDEAEWFPLGQGPGSDGLQTGGLLGSLGVLGLTVYNGDLIAGGFFDQA
ncbi:MAG: hypothetical protein EA377_00700, partial [Phycisphaerales bacterium]